MVLLFEGGLDEVLETAKWASARRLSRLSNFLPQRCGNEPIFAKQLLPTGFTSRVAQALLCPVIRDRTMQKPRLRKRESRRASEACLKALMSKVIEAGAVAKGAADLIAGGDYERAFQAALQIEPILFDASQALNAASIFRVMARDTS